MNSVAKPIVKNKYWIVENNGTKIATIQAIDEGGFAYVHDNQRERFPSIKLLSKKYNIVFDNARPANTKPEHECYGYPCDGRPHNEVWDVQRRLPIYSKEPKSKSYFCAGYYVVKYNNTWIGEYCPKNITIARYEYHGPFATVAEQQNKLNELKV
jgi:hypothetical protein